MEIKDTKKIEEYTRGISILPEISKGIKVKSKIARKIKRKYEITSIYKTRIIKEKLKQKNPKIWKINKILSTQNISRQPSKLQSRNKKSDNRCKGDSTIEELKSVWNNIWNHQKSYYKKSKR